VLGWLESRMLFAGAHSGPDWDPPPDDLNVREINLPLSTGGWVTGWFTALPGWTPGDGAALYSHGNGGNLSNRGEILRLIRDGLGRAVLGHEYPGYGVSPGVPTEAACYASGDAGFDWLVQQKVPADEVILVGESLGGGIAVELASRRDNRLLLTLAAFTSVADMARLAFPWLPLRWFVRNRFDNLRKIAAARGPVFVTHGTDDRVVPFEHGQRLAAAAPPPSRFLPLPAVGHNCLLALRNDRFWSEVRAFIDETRRPHR
jgi:fermentation-respiration switch protein FrsA (DUF1100 family)